MSLETAAVIAATFVLAGLVKGVVGLGLPTVALALLTATIGLKEAMALMLMPSLITNIWQAAVGGALRALLRRFWPLLLSICLGIWLGVRVLATANTAHLSAMLGLLVCLYALFGLLAPCVPAPGRRETWLSPIVGTVNGVLTGLTGTFVVPSVPYLQSLGLKRDELIQAMGIVFAVSTTALALALADRRLIPVELGTASAIGVVPALAGMWLGQSLRKRIAEAQFRKVFFGALLLLGLYIIVKSLFLF